MREKHKKVFKDPILESDLDVALRDLKKQIMAMSERQQHLLLDWIKDWTKYLRFERTFRPDRLMNYKRGDVIYLNMGYNVGSEQGGARYGVVVDKSPRVRPILTVVPLATIGDGKTPHDLHASEVYLGKVVGEVDCYALPLHIRAISKIRIIRPKKAPKIAKLNEEQMTRIDNVIQQYLTKGQ